MNDCIEPPHRKSRGYSSIKGEYAHRYVMRELHVPIAGMVVRHLCFNKRCANPDHLTVGTQTDNLNDADAKAAFKERDRLRHEDALAKPCPTCGGPRQVYDHGGLMRIRCPRFECR